MAAQYSHKQFYRDVANKFLIDYLEHNNIDLGFDLYAIEDNDVDVIFSAYLKLDDATRHKMEFDFQRVHALATDGGILALIDEAREHDNFHFMDKMKDICGLHNKVMWAYLDSPEYWHAASGFFNSDMIPQSSWKLIQDLPPLANKFSGTDINLFSQALGEYYFNKEGRGRHCKVEPYRRGELDYFFAYPEDFAKSETEWIRETLQNLPHTMAFEIVFLYCQEKNSLSIYIKNDRKSPKELQKLFAKYILKAELTNFTPVI
jgi:hypothetical protein